MSSRSGLGRGTAVLIGAALFALPASAAAPNPRCFGAASRDSVVRCVNPALRYRVVPTPDDALLAPNAPCEPVYVSTPYRCEFGVAEDKAAGTIALLGDSHATHWRAAMIGVAKAYGWRGESITRSGCTFSMAKPILPGTLGKECLDWRAQVYQWFGEHPEVRTVFISQHPGAVVVPPGQTERNVKLRGFRDAFQAMPDTVKHIVVIRDTPYVRASTPDCITAALRRHEDAGRTCELRRGSALKEDDAALAAERYPLPRVKVIDMTSYMCDSSLCYPVVGGVLTHKDVGHITAVFSATLGPFLLRKIRALGIRI